MSECSKFLTSFNEIYFSYFSLQKVEALEEFCFQDLLKASWPSYQPLLRAARIAPRSSLKNYKNLLLLKE